MLVDQMLSDRWQYSLTAYLLQVSIDVTISMPGIHIKGIQTTLNQSAKLYEEDCDISLGKHEHGVKRQ